MLRKIKSKSFLSPGKTSKVSTPSTSPSKAQRNENAKTDALSEEEEHSAVPSSPCRVRTPQQKPPACRSESQAERVGHQVASIIATCQALISPPDDGDAYQEHERGGKVRGLRRRASAWLGLTPNHASSVQLTAQPILDNATRSSTKSDDTAASHSRLMALHAAVRCEYSSASDKAQEMLLLVDLRAYLPDPQSRSNNFSPLRVMIILDIKQNLTRHGCPPRQCSIALRIVQHLEVSDHIGIMTTTIGHDKQRIISEVRQVGHNGRRILTELVCNRSLEPQFEETDVAASLLHASRLLDTSEFTQVMPDHFLS